jgi:predicted Zn-dependent protease
VHLTRGYVALRERRYDEALSAANEVLGTSPFDTHAKALKARALLGKQQDDEAVALLLEQIRVEPSDAICLQVLANIYEQRRDWQRLSQIARRLAQLQPANNGHALLAITAAFKAGQSEQGRRDSWKLITSGANSALVSRVLDIWFVTWPAQQRVADAIKLGGAARDPQQRLPYADFLNRVGSPAAALELVKDAAKYPVTADNAGANAVAAEALGLSGKSIEARKRFGEVLAFDPGNPVALRGRAKLLLRLGNAKEAISDAEKLVTVSPATAADRLLLARAYTAAGDAQQAQRTLWDAFHAIPANEQIYGALLHLARSDADSRLALKDEFTRQTATKIDQGLL